MKDLDFNNCKKFKLYLLIKCLFDWNAGFNIPSLKQYAVLHRFACFYLVLPNACLILCCAKLFSNDQGIERIAEIVEIKALHENSRN